MQTTTSKMHEDFIAEIQSKIAGLETDLARLQSELARLRTVEEYHREQTQNGQNITPPVVDTQPPNGSTATTVRTVIHDDLNGKSRHDAALAVMRQEHKKMKAAQIARILRASGVETEVPEKTLITGIFTAMHRKTDLFRNHGQGWWSLQEWGNEEVPNKESPEA